MARVLIVEDDFLIALEISEFVERAGYTVVGPEASVDATTRALSRQGIDLALLDVNLGGELVFPIAKILDAMGVPYIFVTSYSQSVRSIISNRPSSPISREARRASTASTPT